ncbi:conserved hypothetical protein, partial [delta proteobacterium NaphS2]
MKKLKLSLTCLVFLGIFSCAPKEEAKQAPPPPPKVTVYETAAREVPITRN